MDLEVIIERYFTEPETLDESERRLIEGLAAQDPDVARLFAFLKPYYEAYGRGEGTLSPEVRRFVDRITGTGGTQNEPS